MQPTKNYNSHCFGNNVIVTSQSYTVILTGYLFAVSLISHWSLPPFCHVCWCEVRENFMFACGSHRFFICTNYLTIHICNQPCIAFIYFLFISCFFRQMGKEPLPQSVEVLFHAAARATTFLVLAAMWTAAP